MKVIAQIPAHRETVGCHAHQLPLGAYTLKEHHQLQLEEHNWVDRGAATLDVQRSDELSHEREIEPLLQAAAEAVSRDEIL